MNLNTIIGMSFLGLTLSFIAHAAEQPEAFLPFDKPSMKEGATLSSLNPYLHITEIAVNNGVRPEELEGGYLIMFDAEGHLTKDTCSLAVISHAMNKGSLDAHLMMGLRLEVQCGTLTYPIIQHYLAAASGGNGTSHQGNGGTSSYLAFYNLHRVHQIFVDNQKLAQSLPQNIMSKLNELYEQNGKVLPNKAFYKGQIEAIKRDLRSNKTP